MIGEKRWKRWCRQFRWLRGCPGNAKCSTCPSYECNVYMRSQLMSHERSKLHTSKGASACPDVKEFGQIIQERQNGVSLRRSEHGPQKAIKMLWCTSESIKEILKTRMSHGLVTASISQDGQGAGLGVRACIISCQQGLLI